MPWWVPLALLVTSIVLWAVIILGVVKIAHLCAA